MTSTKLQTSSKKQAPNNKQKIKSTKKQAPNSKQKMKILFYEICDLLFVIWNL